MAFRGFQEKATLWRGWLWTSLWKVTQLLPFRSSDKSFAFLGGLWLYREEEINTLPAGLFGDLSSADATSAPAFLPHTTFKAEM